MLKCLEQTRDSCGWHIRVRKDQCVWDVEALLRSGPEWGLVYQEKGFTQKDTGWLLPGAGQDLISFKIFDRVMHTLPSLRQKDFKFMWRDRESDQKNKN